MNRLEIIESTSIMTDKFIQSSRRENMIIEKKTKSMKMNPRPQNLFEILHMYLDDNFYCCIETKG